MCPADGAVKRPSVAAVVPLIQGVSPEQTRECAVNGRSRSAVDIDGTLVDSNYLHELTVLRKVLDGEDIVSAVMSTGDVDTANPSQASSRSR